MKDYHQQKVLILDFGSQYTMLIARRVRELGVYSEIHPSGMSLEQIRALAPKAIILSGGPASVLEKGSPTCPKELFQLGIPVLGICYGMQLMTHLLKGKVARSKKREYGPAELIIDESSELFAGILKKVVLEKGGTELHHDLSSSQPPNPPRTHKPISTSKKSLRVWMSHGDRIEIPPPGFIRIAHSENSPFAGIADPNRKLFGVQFHPEVAHTPLGKYILANFLFRISHLKKWFNPGNFIENSLREIREKVQDQKVILGLSGGVDSSVAAVLIHRAIQDQLICIFVNNGLLRDQEPELILKIFKNYFKIPLKYVDATSIFLKKLKGIKDPEEKRKIIGKTFIQVFEKEAKRVKGARFLAQGTLYPDLIESTSFRGPSSKIKSHHNVGGLPKRMKLKLLEPLRELFKDEVREIGRELGLPDEILWRQPFPGPGLAVRIIGEVTKAQIEKLKKADAIVREEIEKAGLGRQIWQYFAVLLPVKTVGVMGDERTYENVVVVRAVKSLDGMTADWADLPHSLLGRISNRIINEVKGVNRVAYDISSKPPSTIEWE